MDNAKIEHEHRRIARIEHDEIQRIEELRKEDERAYGTMADVHKVGKAMIHHLNNLMHLGRKQLRLLKEDARIRQELGEANADSDYNALLQDILRMGGIIDWLQSNVNVMRGDKKMQKELDRRLEEFDRLVLDVSSRLRHLDMILELGDRLEPIPESAFH
jgi:hypothetical protein